MDIRIASSGKALIFCGAVLFLIGLFQGALIPYFLNPRMGLSAHLAAVQSGMALMVFGVIWGALALRETWLKVACYSSISSMYLIWIAITHAAISGASRSLPMAGKGFSATPFNEMAVTVVISTGSVLCLVSGALIVFGLYKGLVKK